MEEKEFCGRARQAVLDKLKLKSDISQSNSEEEAMAYIPMGYTHV